MLIDLTLHTYNKYKCLTCLVQKHLLVLYPHWFQLSPDKFIIRAVVKYDVIN